MTYHEWFEAHAARHAKIMQKLEGSSDEEVIAYFAWENLSKAEPDFCPLFAQNKKCHDMEDLNCYLCGCPEFRFDDSAPYIQSRCAIDARGGRQIEIAGRVHQDCSGCLVPHRKGYIRKHFDRDWKKIMCRVVARES